MHGCAPPNDTTLVYTYYYNYKCLTQPFDLSLVVPLDADSSEILTRTIDDDEIKLSIYVFHIFVTFSFFYIHVCTLISDHDPTILIISKHQLTDNNLM